MSSSTKDVEENAPTVQNDDASPSNRFIMNLNIWNKRKSKLLSKFRKAYIFFAVSILAILLFFIVLMVQIKLLSQDVHALKAQIMSVRYKYDSQQNRSRLRRLAHYDLIGSINPLIREFSDLMEKEMVNSESESNTDDRVFVDDLTTLTSNFYSNQEASRSVLDRSVDHENNTSKTNDSTILNGITTSPMTFENDSIVDPAKQGVLCNTTCEMQNRMARDAAIDGDNELSLARESRGRRFRRDEGRAPLVATFIGAVPEQCITNSALIGPWIKKGDEYSQYDLAKFHLVEKRMAIEITTNGLYSISAQIFYFGELKKHSYWILLSSEGLSKPQQLVKCATTTSNVAAEVSCYTSIIMHMKRGDRLYIEQQERDRLINLREGYSYIQLVLLANDAQKKRST
ncbi:uncharacterized protein LOC105279800 isoform X2 [Ooceraea biroi]|uniref:Uncharacterized protein n=1 Tax=Ooceraea biroi TaxID=2015173 RepID=A0A026WGB7_OOCBI|nr:uncharacterized protein LOC105279800 isoform X2 [Ooceraea biroi]EZA54726.1 hypothetical protein X777_05011 [Ooceraea biroi]